MDIMFYSGGSITIGTDRNVYITLGDKTVTNLVQNTNFYAGSIIRVTQDGKTPADNWGMQAPGRKPECWARGLRNGFRSTWDFKTDKFYIFEVGGNDQATAQEDIHVGRAGANYGWPYCEGTCGNKLFPSCPCSAGYDNPIYTYIHRGTTQR